MNKLNYDLKLKENLKEDLSEKVAGGQSIKMYFFVIL
jgi:hypothetical protein